MTYFIAGWAGTSVLDRVVHYAKNELAIFDPPSGQNCSSYLSQYFEMDTIGQLLNPAATFGCEEMRNTHGHDKKLTVISFRLNHTDKRRFLDFFIISS